MFVCLSLLLFLFFVSGIRLIMKVRKNERKKEIKKKKKDAQPLINFNSSAHESRVWSQCKVYSVYDTVSSNTSHATSSRLPVPGDSKDEGRKCFI